MKSYKYNNRKIHRYLGLIIGLQFLLWTLGGLYFSWSDMDEIHGDYLVNEKITFWKNSSDFIGFKNAFLQTKNKLDSISSAKLISIIDEPYYQLVGLKNGERKVILLHAQNGEIRPPLNKVDAIEIANRKISFEAEISEIEYLTELGKHHEYRKKPLPAWAITFDYEGSPTAYVSVTHGQFVNIRHNNWRIFDWLWMLHTMDYTERDRIGNFLLRSFSILGLITIFSGFTLFYTSSPTIRKWTRKRNK